MPRRHQRNDEIPPLAITSAEIPKPPPPPKSRTQRKREYDARADARWTVERERRKKARAEAVDWSRCLVPLCEAYYSNGGRPKDPEQRIPLCLRHEAMVWRLVQSYNGEPGIAQATEQLEREHREREEAAKVRRLADLNGDIYYLRLNGLIKVGWSRDLYARLRAYGPDVEILCHHKGSRDDETNLHRNLRPFLARGREWYEDCQAMRDIVSKAIAIHGEPTAAASWTRPTEPPIKTRRR